MPKICRTETKTLRDGISKQENPNTKIKPKTIIKFVTETEKIEEEYTYSHTNKIQQINKTKYQV